MEVNKPIKGFIKLTHKLKSGGAFKLKKEVDGSTIIEVNGTGGPRKPIDNVIDVSLYYWDGAPDNPILLGITKKDEPQPTFYGRARGYKTWRNGTVPNMNEQQALDNQNCHNNGAVPFNIQDSRTGNFLKDNKITCVKNIRKIESTSSLNPPGSEYIATGYMITGHDTKISRVTYKEKYTTDLTPPTYSVGVIRLYSYLGAINVPLMLEFKSSNDETSRWFYSTDLDGKQWKEYGSGNNGFYADTDNSKPTIQLSEQLDKVLCFRYSNVTINLTKTHSEHHATGGDKNKYCCNEHKNERKISVVPVQVSCKNLSHISSHTTAYKHTIRGGKLAGVFYKDDGQRKNIKLHGSPFPIDGVDNVYAFYCQGEEPSLIYVESENPAARGWYKNSNGQWMWILQLSGIKRTHIETGLTCAQWTRLKEVLSPLGCSSLIECSYGSNNQQQVEDEKQLDKEEKEAEKERNKALKASLTTPVLENSPSTINSDAAGPPGESGGDKDVEEGKAKAEETIPAQSTQSGTLVQRLEASDAGNVSSPQNASQHYQTDQGEQTSAGKKGEDGTPVPGPGGAGEVQTNNSRSMGTSLSWESIGSSIRGLVIGAVDTAATLLTPAKKHAQPQAAPVQEPGTTPDTDDASGDSTITTAAVSSTDASSGHTQLGDGSEGAASQGADKGEATLPEARKVPSGGSPGSSPNSSNNGWKVIFGGSASATVVSGSLTGFGWWIYKRSRGDPWVRQI
ncbi:hypothetical protein BEWA_038730 [Theileria equi strain WA]|uniref:Uncharacterized protein n=1 Tax=Theileria equi strain WA TaxID=1537102 RepID=L1LF21_THEEQ|nr:hypothetical protein BEWA_038730 [Theileria equi strain WA]EKX73835.1 hypothetical protein BEWA_038730 [Theileria equi strain WA]|eukprot:XP_004833287.1 hypothetical protein BEWA_038730 [Theileria equi strain WA]